MRVVDPRRLSPVSQEDLRRRVVRAVGSGMSHEDAARTFGVSTRSVSRWVKSFRSRGNRGLDARKRGRRPGEQKALQPRQETRIKRAVVGKYPDQLALPGLVWTREQVGELIYRWFGIRLSRVTIGNYLHAWGLSPQKPTRVAYEKNPQAVQHWLEVEYPAIAARAKREKAMVLWLDQTGLRSEAAVGTTWGLVGQTPVVPKTGKRFGVNAMCALSNKGELYFTVFKGGFNVGVVIEFLDRLTRQLERKIHLIVDRHPSHRAQVLHDWLAQHSEQIEMHFLPSYSPELNPVEVFNADLKRHVTARTSPRSAVELADETRTHLRRRQNQPARVRALFGKKEVRYAADPL